MRHNKPAPSHPVAADTHAPPPSSARLRRRVGGLWTRRTPLHLAIGLLVLTAGAFGVLDALGPGGGALQSAAAPVQEASNGSDPYPGQLRLLANWNKVLLARSHLERAVLELDQHHTDQAQVYIRRAAKTLQTLSPAAIGLETAQYHRLVKAVAALEPGGATMLEAERTRVLQIVKQLDGLDPDIAPLDPRVYY